MKNYKRILEYIIRRFKDWNIRLYLDDSSYLNVIHVHATTMNIGDEILSDAIRSILQDDNIKFIYYTNTYKKTSKNNDKYINNLFQIIKITKNCDTVIIGGGFVVNLNTNKCKYEPMCFTKDFCPNLLTMDEWRFRFESFGFSVKKISSALPPWIPLMLDMISSSFTCQPFINKIISRLVPRRFLQALYRRGFMFS